MILRLALCTLLFAFATALPAHAQGDPPGDPDIPDGPPPSGPGPVTGVESEPAITAALFPNPYRDRITIDYRARSRAPLQILVYTRDGKLIAQQQKAQAAGQFEIDLPNEKFAGDLIIQIRSGDQQVSYKVLKE